MFNVPFKNTYITDTWLAQSVEHETLELGVIISSPMLSIEII